MKSWHTLFLGVGLLALALVGYSYLSYLRASHAQTMAIQCSEAAKKWHNEEVQYETAMMKINPYFVSHYNISDGNCYVTVMEDWGGLAPVILSSDFVYSVYENKMVLEDETPSGNGASDIYAKYTSDAASSTLTTEQEYNALYKYYLSQ